MLINLELVVLEMNEFYILKLDVGKSYKQCLRGL